MTLAVRLRCTCRRTVATFDHGAEWIEPAKRAELLSAPTEADPSRQLIASVWPEQLGGCLYWCTSCNRRLTYSPTEFDRARQRSEVTGRPVDVMPAAVHRG